MLSCGPRPPLPQSTRHCDVVLVQGLDHHHPIEAVTFAPSLPRSPPPPHMQVRTLPTFLETHPEVKLVVMDSVAFHFRHAFQVCPVSYCTFFPQVVSDDIELYWRTITVVAVVLYFLFRLASYAMRGVAIA